jgi:hypothetical protein
VRPSILSVLLDYRCNYACAHCSVGSSPTTIYPLPEDVLNKALDELPSLPSINIVTFTGGEPTLRKAVLLRAIRRCRDLGLTTRIVSNGWWARTPEKAEAFVAALIDAGLTELNTSFDSYHEEYGSIERIANLAAAVWPTKLRLAIAVIEDSSGTYNAAIVRREIASRLGKTEDEVRLRMFILDDFPTPTGTAADLDVSGMSNPRAGVGCLEIISTLSLHPDGTVRACCGHAVFYNNDLILGDIRTESMQAILERARKNLGYWLIHTLGPQRILRRLGVEDEFTNICHACNVLLSEHRDEFVEFVKQNASQLFVEDVLLDDSARNALQIALSNKDQMLDRIESVVKAREQFQGSADVQLQVARATAGAPD